MASFSAAMSLVASWVSGVTVLGTGTEIYLYGTQYCFIFIAILVSAIFLHFIIIPVLHDIQVTSVYEVCLKASIFKRDSTDSVFRFLNSI